MDFKYTILLRSDIDTSDKTAKPETRTALFQRSKNTLFLLAKKRRKKRIPLDEDSKVPSLLLC